MSSSKSKQAADKALSGPPENLKGTAEGEKGIGTEDTEGKDKISPIDGKVSQDPLAGLNQGLMTEMFPNYRRGEGESPFQDSSLRGKNNAWIILGRDRRIGKGTGYGGRGHTRCGAIDIVAGLQGWDPKEGSTTDPTTGTLTRGEADKSFGSMDKGNGVGDAARIYISQRTDIDDYFDICDGSVGRSFADSAIGMKADSIRIMSRKGIKLITQENPPGRNSVDGKMDVVYGIDLIAGNRDADDAGKLRGGVPFPEHPYLQPIPKGLNLEDCLSYMMNHTRTVSSILSDFAALQMQINTAFALYPRGGVGFFGIPIVTTWGLPPQIDPSMSVASNFWQTIIKGTFKMQANVIGELGLGRKVMNALELDYLDTMGARYINSKLNRTN